MNYSKIIIDGYGEKKTQQTSYVSYFKRIAQINKRDNFVEFADFFNGCKVAVKEYKDMIIKQYEEELGHNKYCLSCYQQAIGRGQTTDNKGEPIQVHIDYLTREIRELEEQGINDNYKSCNFEYKYKDKDNNRDITVIDWFVYSDIKQLEQGIIQAYQELIPTTNNANNQHQQSPIPDNILNELEKEKLITKEPLHWVGAKNLCAYFVDDYFKNQTKKWEIGKKLFGVENLAQLKDLYENNKGGKPRGYETIDKIIKING